MQINAHGRCSKSLNLGIQTNMGLVNTRALEVATAWAPKGSKSFTIDSLQHTNYDGEAQPQETGYATMIVSYYSTRKEGKIILDKNPKIV